MTGFASATGAFETYSWAWELRSVNARGLDMRLRVPDWISGLETVLRTRLGKSLKRGSVSLTLRVSREEEAGTLSLNPAQLKAVLSALAEVEDQALQDGISLAPSKASDILNLRGVLESGGAEEDTAALSEALAKAFEPLLQAFIEMRQGEGAALAAVLADQLDQVETLVQSAMSAAENRRGDVTRQLQEALARVVDNTDAVEPARVAQELAMIAVKSDITEELDRLRAHVAAARELLQAGGPVGRKLDFLMQEFNREANTLCSKANFTELTRAGLDLKAVIDQMREQVQNVE